MDTVAVTKAIIRLKDVQEKFGLQRLMSPSFFPEWCGDLPPVTDAEKGVLDQLKQRYFYYAEDGAITESTIRFILLARLLELLNLCDPPYRIQAEKSVQVELDDPDAEDGMILEGRIDALIVQSHLWLVLIEAKRYAFNVSLAILQALTYMMANPNRDRNLFGLVMNGEDYIFIKLDPQSKQYDLSDKLTLAQRDSNCLYQVVSILKRLLVS